MQNGRRRQKNCWFGLQCHYRLQFCPFRHPRKVVFESNNANTRHLKNYNDSDQFRGSWKNPNNSIVTFSDSLRNCSSANYFQPLATLQDNNDLPGKDIDVERGPLCGGPQRAVGRSGQRRTPHRPIHTYPRSNNVNTNFNSSTAEWQNTHTHKHIFPSALFQTSMLPCPHCIRSALMHGAVEY